MMVPFSSAKEKTSVGDDGFPEKNGTRWSGHVVELNPVAITMESLPGRILSLMMLPLSSAEEKTSVGDDKFPEKNETGWSGRIVELDPVAVAA